MTAEANELSGQNTSDFASAAIMRLIALGLRTQQISLPVPKTQGAHVPRSHKHELLGTVLADHGVQAILRIADFAPLMPFEPVVRALRQAVGAKDLLDRWSRMERFSHGRHFVLQSPLEPSVYRLEHRARSDGPGPSRAESLLVLALITILIELSGDDVVLMTEDGTVIRSGRNWQAFDENLILRTVIVEVQSASISSRYLQPRSSGHLIDDIQRLADDPCRRWSVDRFAELLASSRRSLQRRLEERQTSFSDVVLEVRLELAAEQLCQDREISLAQIGFLNGFSDQPHFTRLFSRKVGVTPGVYRDCFGSGKNSAPFKTV
jgi:AraC-like DNA-binding protein